MNVTRIILILILILSLFTTTKSFLAVQNVEVWSDELWSFMVSDLQRPSERNPIQFYESRLDKIQSEWKVMRWIGVSSTLLTAALIVLVSLDCHTGRGMRRGMVSKEKLPGTGELTGTRHE